MEAADVLLNPIPESCRKLGIGRTTLYRMINQGVIRAVKIADRTLIPETELQRYVDELIASAQRSAVAEQS